MLGRSGRRRARRTAAPRRPAAAQPAARSSAGGLSPRSRSPATTAMAQRPPASSRAATPCRAAMEASTNDARSAQILHRVSGQHQLGEHHDPGPAPGGAAGPLDDQLGVSVRSSPTVGIDLGKRDPQHRAPPGRGRSRLQPVRPAGRVGRAFQGGPGRIPPISCGIRWEDGIQHRQDAPGDSKPPGLAFDASVAHPARVCNYWLGRQGQGCRPRTGKPPKRYST